MSAIATARSWIARAREPHLKPPSPSSTAIGAREYVKEGKFSTSSFRELEKFVTVARDVRRTCPTIHSIHRLGKIEELRHLLRLPTSPPDLYQPPFPLSLSPPERYNHVRCHRRRHRSEKEVNACERVLLGKELGQEPMVRSARWSDRF